MRTTILFGGNITKNEEIDLIKITKNEAEIMRKNGYGQFVKYHHPSHYLVEDRYDTYYYDKKSKTKVVTHLSPMSFLEKHRKEHTVYTYTGKK